MKIENNKKQKQYAIFVIKNENRLQKTFSQTKQPLRNHKQLNKLIIMANLNENGPYILYVGLPANE